MSDQITIRRAETPDDYHNLQVTQRLAWGITDDSYILPIATMVGAQWHGGLVLGAFLPDGEAVGLSFGFLGRFEGRIGLYSQLTGVVPGFQGTGLGSRMKFAQRDHCRAEGITVIAWAFDPMQAGNARFNLQRLGATSKRLIENMYGPRTDALNRGAPADRLIVEWEVDAAPRIEPTLEEIQHIPRLVSYDGPASVPRLGTIDALRVLLEIPPSITTLRAQDPGMAGIWQATIVKTLAQYFTKGYSAVGFLRWELADGETMGGYLLEKV